MKQIELKLAALWTGHFLLWTFSDMLSLLQNVTEPAPDKLLLLVAVPLAIIQVFMILTPLFFKRKMVKTVAFISIIIFLFFNILNIFDVSHSWEYLLTAAFIAVNIITAIVLFKWKKA